MWSLMEWFGIGFLYYFWKSLRLGLIFFKKQLAQFKHLFKGAFTQTVDLVNGEISDFHTFRRIAKLTPDYIGFPQHKITGELKCK